MGHPTYNYPLSTRIAFLGGCLKGKMSIFKFGFRVGGSQETRLASRILVMIVMYSCGDLKEGPDMHIGLYSILPHSLLLLSHSLPLRLSFPRSPCARKHACALVAHVRCIYSHVMYVRTRECRKEEGAYIPKHAFTSMHTFACMFTLAHVFVQECMPS